MGLHDVPATTVMAKEHKAQTAYTNNEGSVGRSPPGLGASDTEYETSAVGPEVLYRGIVILAPRIASARALVADDGALARLLGEVPQAAEILPELAKPYFTRRWQQSLKRSFWISSDGITTECLTLTGLSVDEVIAIWISVDDYRSPAPFALSAYTLKCIIEGELGLTVELAS